MKKPYTITVGDLLDDLANYDRSDHIFFGSGDLSFSRIKSRGDKLAGIEFNQIYTVTVDPETE